MIKKILLGLLVLIITLVGAFYIYVQTSWDKKYDMPYPDLVSSTDSVIVARGEYLVKGPAHCSNCHVASLEELERADSGEDLPLRGGAKLPMGPLGYITTKNLTHISVHLRLSAVNPPPQTASILFIKLQSFRCLCHKLRILS